MGDTTNNQVDPAIAEILSQRQKEMDDSSPKEGKKVAPTQSAVEPSGDPDIDAIIAQRQKDLPNSNASPPAPKTTEAQTQPDSWENVKANVLSKLKGVNKTDAEAMGAGAVAGYALPKAIEEISEGRTATPANELQYKQLSKVAEKPADSNSIRNQTIDDLMREHYARQNELINKLNNAQQYVEGSANELQKAKIEHANNMLMSHEDFLPPEFRVTNVAPESVLTRQPIGGTATESYGEKFGLSPLESLNAPSMSQVQKKIPGIASSIVKAQELGPEFGKFKESPLLVGPEAQQALAEEAAKQQAHEQAKAQAHENAKRALAVKKAASQIKLDALNEIHSSNLSQLNNLNRQLEKHQSTSPIPASERIASAEKEDALSEAKAKIEKYYPSNKVLRPLAFIGRQLGARATPMFAGAMAPEQAMKAKELLDKEEYAKAAAYGLGALGSVGMATGIPWVSGLGAVANLPSIGLEAYELGSKPVKP